MTATAPAPTNSATTADGKAVVLYDGACPFCRAGVSVLAKLDWLHVLHYQDARRPAANRGPAPTTAEGRHRADRAGDVDARRPERRREPRDREVSRRRDDHAEVLRGTEDGDGHRGRNRGH